MIIGLREYIAELVSRFNKGQVVLETQSFRPCGTRASTKKGIEEMVDCAASRRDSRRRRASGMAWSIIDKEREAK